MNAVFILTIASLLMLPVWGISYMGQDISTSGNGGNCMLSIRQCWKQDIELSRINDTLSLLNDEELGKVYTALDEYVQAATEARAALVNFAVYSMKSLRITQPKSYQNALAQYHRALNILFTCDMEQLRVTSVLTPADRTAGIKPEADTLGEAMQKRINQNVETFRTARTEYLQFKEHSHRKLVEFVLNLLAGDRPTCEFITNTPLDNTPQDYTANCTTKFQIAYAAWQKYADCAVRMHCPVPRLQGNSTPGTMADMKLILQKHFEQFLTILTGGLGR